MTAQSMIDPSSRSVFSSSLVLVLVIVGIILFFIGMMVTTSVVFIKSPKYSDYPDYDQYEQALKDYTTKVNNVRGSGSILIELSGMIACIGLFGGAIDNKTLAVNLKCAFISGGISFLITVMIILTIFGR